MQTAVHYWLYRFSGDFCKLRALVGLGVWRRPAAFLRIREVAEGTVELISELFFTLLCRFGRRKECENRNGAVFHIGKLCLETVAGNHELPDRPDPIVFVFTDSVGGSQSWAPVHWYAWVACHELAHAIGFGFGFDFSPPNPITTAIVGTGSNSQQLKERWGWSGSSSPLPPIAPDTIPERNLNSLLANIGRAEPDEPDVSGSAIYLGVLPWSTVSYDGSIDRYGDEDWFAFELSHTSGETLNLTVMPWLMQIYPTKLAGTNTWAHSMDPKVALYDSDLNLLDNNNPIGETAAGFQANLSYDPSGNSGSYGLYYLKVEAAEAGGSKTHGDVGHYILNATFD